MEPKNELKNKKKFWSSNLGIFILSAIFLTLIPFLYTNIQNSISERKTDSQQRVKISSEIIHRLNTVKQLTYNKIPHYQIIDIRLATFGIKESLKPKYYNFNSIFKEFENTTLLSLIYQLDNITCSKKKKKFNQNLKMAIENIKPIVDELVLNPKYRQKRVTNITNGNWTYDYYCSDSLKNQINKKLISPINKWIKNW